MFSRGADSVRVRHDLATAAVAKIPRQAVFRPPHRLLEELVQGQPREAPMLPTLLRFFSSYPRTCSQEDFGLVSTGQVGYPQQWKMFSALDRSVARYARLSWLLRSRVARANLTIPPAPSIETTHDSGDCTSLTPRIFGESILPFR